MLSFPRYGVLWGCRFVLASHRCEAHKRQWCGIDPTRYVNCSILQECFIVCSATLLIIRGYVNARDRMMEKEGHTDSDLADYTGVTVPFGSVFRFVWQRVTKNINA